LNDAIADHVQPGRFNVKKYQVALKGKVHPPGDFMATGMRSRGEYRN
jgi:hypothetical protein